jgi:branched-chain amino acid transport system substrate-binding protein
MPRAARSIPKPPVWLFSLGAAIAFATGCDRGAPYRIGMVLDADGVRGATIAAEQINASGGIHGHRLELRNIGGGGSTKAKLALETAESLATDPSVLAVVGHTNSSASLAASQVYNARHVVQIAPTSTTPLYGDAGPYSFRLVASDVHQGVFLADQALMRKAHPRIAMVFVNDDYGRPLGNVVRERLLHAGVVPVYDAPYSEKDSHPDIEVATSLAQARPDVLIWIGRAYDYASMQPLFTKAVPGLEVIASDGFGGPALLTDSSQRFDGVRYVRLIDVDRPDSTLRALRARYVHDGLGEPSDQAVLSYDAVSLLAEAIRQAGPSREALREWLAKVGRGAPAFRGLSGPIAFASRGDRAPAYFLKRIDGRTPVPRHRGALE